MKKSFIALLTVFALLGCNDSDSSNSPSVNPPPVYRDTLTFLQNVAPEYNAIIFKDNILLSSSYFTVFTYAVENMTRETYNNISLSIEPASDKYRLSASECTTLNYKDGCLIYVYINVKNEEVLNFKIKMKSDKGEQEFTPKSVKSAYIAQPKDVSNKEVTALSIPKNGSETFLVRNSMPYRTIIRGDAFSSGSGRITPFSVVHSTLDANTGFAINTASEIRKFTVDGKDYRFRNCFDDYVTVIINNESTDACYVEVSYTGTNPGVDTAELSIERKTNPSATEEQIPWKYAKVKLISIPN